MHLDELLALGRDGSGDHVVRLVGEAVQNREVEVRVVGDDDLVLVGAGTIDLGRRHRCDVVGLRRRDAERQQSCGQKCRDEAHGASVSHVHANPFRVEARRECR